jgi:predicted glycosyltransferase
MELKKRILVAPLNWGLGHATRCIPIINALLDFGFEPVIGSDGAAMGLLTKEFPKLEFIELPAYDISYSKNPNQLKYKLLTSTPKVLRAVKIEKKIVKNLVTKGEIQGIISDSRFGVRSKKVPSVYMTHQLNVLSGSTTWFSSKMHNKVIKKYDECWVPDIKGDNNLSGNLGHVGHSNLNIKYLGIISRFKKIESEKIYDLMVLLSGPEPQRSLLEKHLLKELKEYKGRVLFIRGVIENKQHKEQIGNVQLVNYMVGEELELAINKSKAILSRSGYTTILDLAKLGKQAYFIPTPGQFEQAYLAKRLDEMDIVPHAKQDEFRMTDLSEIGNYSGFTVEESDIKYRKLFRLFEGK